MKNKGFTLIETVIYIALFTILITSGFVAAYSLIEGTGNLDSKLQVQQEGNFVLKKIGWALSNLSSVETPTGLNCAESLTIHKTDSTDPVDIRLTSSGGVNYIEMRTGGGGYYPISTVNVNVSCLKFSIISGSPLGIVATTTISGIDFSITRYIRK